MEEQTRRYRSDKKPSNKGKGNRILNYLIAIVILLIIIVAAIIFSGGNDNNVANEKTKEQTTEVVKEKEQQEEEPAKSEEATTEEKSSEEAAKEEELAEKEATEDLPPVEKLKSSETAKVTAVNDGIVTEAIEDESWEPFKTAQDTSVAHQSSYDDQSVDWQEKIAAIATVTSLKEEDLTVWYIKNNGGANTAIGTVSSKDQKDKYRVSLVWEEKQGWKPVKVEVLSQIKGAY